MYSNDPAADRACFQEAFGFSSVDAGHGWLIFALPPAEIAVHHAEENVRSELYFMCTNLKADITALEGRASTAHQWRRRGGVR